MQNVDMSTINQDYIDDIIKDIAAECIFKNYKYSQLKFDTQAQNYFGVIIPIALSGEKDGRYIKINIVLKLAPTDERFRVSGALTAMFAREIYIYTVVLKKYEEIQRNKNFTSQYVIPRCYYVCNKYCKELIAMQNMCGDNYKPFTEGMFLNFEHITISIKSLAKLHALSFILRNEDCELYEHIVKNCVPLTEKNNKRYIDIMVDRLSKAIQKFHGTEYVPLLERLKLNCAKCFDLVAEDINGTCICHGDIWKENVLFKYEDGTPTSACLIDYQSTRMASPAFDTLYLIISSTDTNLRRKHYYQLLETYYQTFEQMLKEVGLESHSLYSRQSFDQALRVVWPACLITANTALWLSSGLQEEGHVRSKHIWTNQEDKDMAVLKYKQIIKDIIEDLCDYGYLNVKKNEFNF